MVPIHLREKNGTEEQTIITAAISRCGQRLNRQKATHPAVTIPAIQRSSAAPAYQSHATAPSAGGCFRRTVIFA